MQGTEGVPTEAYEGTPQGEMTEGNAADDTLMVDQDHFNLIDRPDKKVNNTRINLENNNILFFILDMPQYIV